MLIDEFRSAADPAAQERRSAEHLERDLEKTARELYRLIVAPIEKELPADTSEVILSPAGHLNFVSLSALIADDGRFWAEKRRLHFVSSGRDLLRSPATMSKAAPSLLVGAPDFQLANAADGTIAAPGKDGFVGSLIVAVRGTRETATELSQAFSDLEGTRTELTLVEDILKKAGFSVEARSDANATERNLRAISSPPILHLATHGFFFDQLAVGSGTANRLGEAITDPMLLGGVALAGIKNTFAAWERGRMPPPEDDGFLCAYEAANLKLDGTFLVTLSACETGLGEATGSNGVLGLKRGFLQAGAKNLLHTLWKVADVETVEFMRQFYTAVAAGQHPSHALIETQRTLLAKWRRERGLRAAINLAGPFVLTSGTAIPEK
jgi:CHAT domain-containing protein